MTMKQNLRRKGALERLEAQLKSGVKTLKGTVNKQVKLSDKDISRIKNQILTLKSRIK